MKLKRVKNFAKSQDLPQPTVYRWHREGKFPGLFVKLGRILFIDEDEFWRLVKAAQGKEVRRK